MSEHKCLNCGAPFDLAVYTKAENESRVRFTLTPSPGENFALKNFGGALTALDQTFAAVGKDLGVPTVTILEKIEHHADGTIEAHLIITRGDKVRARKKRLAAAKGGEK